MEIGPLLSGRTPQMLSGARLLGNLQNAQQDIARLRDQISTSQKYVLPSENPASTLLAINLAGMLERKTQMQTNVQTSRSLLAASEAALASVNEALNKARQIGTASIGDAAGPQEKAAMAVEVRALVRQVANVGNTLFRGRYLFGGSFATQPPFTLMEDGTVRYEGDRQSLEAWFDLSHSAANNVDGHSAFAALAECRGSDLNPALTLSTRLADLNGGNGFVPGAITITLSSPALSATVDLSAARTITDLKAQIEDALGPANVTVGINAARNGLLITPAAGTISIADAPGGATAASLGLVASSATSIDSQDLNPRVTVSTLLADLNGGTGIGPVAGRGLRIRVGETTTVLDLSAATTVEDVLNLLRRADLNLLAEIDEAGSGLFVASRLSGTSFAIGENSGQNATLLGIRTLTAQTSLAELNYGRGVPVNQGVSLEITRRDGSQLEVDLSGATTVQDVLDRINAVDPGVLVASLRPTGNGLALVDLSGTGPLAVAANPVGEALGIAGTEGGGNPAVALEGADVNQREPAGSLNILLRLQRALETNDRREIERAAGLLDNEVARLTSVRADLGGRLRTLENVDTRLKDEEVQLKEALANESEVDLAELLTQLVARQTAFEAALRAAAQTLQLSLANYL